MKKPATKTNTLAKFSGHLLLVGAGKMGSGLHVFWRDNSSDETGFELERKAGAGEFAKVAKCLFELRHLGFPCLYLTGTQRNRFLDGREFLEVRRRFLDAGQQ